MRVVSLVPSWTETLLACGVNVVGRTRFCVHPDSARALPAVGGTKDLKQAELAALKPDLVILDKEENLPFMAEAQEWKTHVTHVQSAQDVPGELDALAGLLAKRSLAKLAEEWRLELASPVPPQPKVDTLPGLIQWIRRPSAEPETLIYLIWRSPWMSVSRDTFVGSMVTQVGFGGRLPVFPERYPKIDLSSFDPRTTTLLFSSEPYPFGKKTAELGALDFPSALVDGEAYSWFGIRSLRFLQALRD